MSNQSALTPGANRPIVKASDYWKVELDKRRAEEENLSMSSMALSDDESENTTNHKSVDIAISKPAATLPSASTAVKASGAIANAKPSTSSTTAKARPTTTTAGTNITSASSNAKKATITTKEREVTEKKTKEETHVERERAKVPSAEALKNSNAVARRLFVDASLGGDDSFASSTMGTSVGDSLWSQDVDQSADELSVNYSTATPRTIPSRATKPTTTAPTSASLKAPTKKSAASSTTAPTRVSQKRVEAPPEKVRPQVPSAEMLKHSAAVAKRANASIGGDDSFASSAMGTSVGDSLWSDNLDTTTTGESAALDNTGDFSNIDTSIASTAARRRSTSVRQTVQRDEPRARAAVPSAEMLKNSAAMVARRRSEVGVEADDSFASSVGDLSAGMSLWSDNLEHTSVADTIGSVKSSRRASVARNAGRKSIAAPQDASDEQESSPLKRLLKPRDTGRSKAQHVPSAEALKHSAAMAKRDREPEHDGDSFASSTVGSLMDTSLWSEDVGLDESLNASRPQARVHHHQPSAALQRFVGPRDGALRTNVPSAEMLKNSTAMARRNAPHRASVGGDESFASSVAGASIAGDSFWSDEVGTSIVDDNLNAAKASAASEFLDPNDVLAIRPSAQFDQYRWDPGEDEGVRHASDFDDDGNDNSMHMADMSVRTPGEVTLNNFPSTSPHGSISGSPRKATFMMPPRPRTSSSGMGAMTGVGNAKKRPRSGEPRYDPGAPQYVFEEMKSPTMNGRKLRKRIPKLDYHRNERVVYGYRDTTSSMPSVIGVIRNMAMDVTSTGMPVQKRQKTSEADDVPMDDSMDVFDESGQSLVNRVVSIPTPEFSPLSDDSAVYISEAFGGVTGWIKMAYNVEQQFDADPDQSKVFFVAKGTVLLTIANKTTRIPQFGSFVVPPHNDFTIAHAKVARTPILLSFVALPGTQLPSATPH